MDAKTRKALEAPRPVEKSTCDGDKGVTHVVEVTCFNRDLDGRCMAFKEGVCSKECSARIPTIGDKIKLLESLMAYSKSKVITADLNKELVEAQKVQRAEMTGKYEDWMSCYYEDRHRGSGGGSSEHDSNRSTGMKTLLKDNRSVGVKPTKSQNAEYQTELKKWEEENGKLPKLARSSLGKSKTDSYLEND